MNDLLPICPHCAADLKVTTMAGVCWHCRRPLKEEEGAEKSPLQRPAEPVSLPAPIRWIFWTFYWAILLLLVVAKGWGIFYAAPLYIVLAAIFLFSGFRAVEPWHPAEKVGMLKAAQAASAALAIFAVPGYGDGDFALVFLTQVPTSGIETRVSWVIRFISIVATAVFTVKLINALTVRNPGDATTG